MKKTLAMLLSAAMLISVSGCGNNNEAPTNTEPPKNETSVQEDACDFYNEMQTNFRPIAVMIDNDDKNARPQLGLESAYLIYEMVVEGSATRFMALYKNADLKKIGPIRSSRHYFLDYVQENDARYVHAGWSDKAALEIQSNKINNINGLTDNIFWRDKTYDDTWHNLYTGMDKVEELMKEKGYRSTSDVKLFEYHKNPVTPEGEDAVSLYIDYAPFYDVEFRYNEETKLYERYVNNNPHKSQTGDILTAKNIIVYDLANVPLNDGIYAPRQEINTVGSGEGYYMSEGKSVKITWKKTSRSAQTSYTDENGEKIILNPGQTYIQIAPTAVGYTIS